MNACEIGGAGQLLVFSIKHESVQHSLAQWWVRQVSVFRTRHIDTPNFLDLGPQNCKGSAAICLPPE